MEEAETLTTHYNRCTPPKIKSPTQGERVSKTPPKGADPWKCVYINFKCISIEALFPRNGILSFLSISRSRLVIIP